MFFFLLFFFTLLTTNFFFFACDYNDYDDDDDDDYVGSRCRRAGPNDATGIVWAFGMFFFAVTLLLLVTNYDIVFRFL